MDLAPSHSQDRVQTLEVAVRARRPVFERMRDAVPGFVYDNFYPARCPILQGTLNTPALRSLILLDDLPIAR